MHHPHARWPWNQHPTSGAARLCWNSTCAAKKKFRPFPWPHALSGAKLLSKTLRDSDNITTTAPGSAAAMLWRGFNSSLARRALAHAAAWDCSVSTSTAEPLNWLAVRDPRRLHGHAWRALPLAEPPTQSTRLHGSSWTSAQSDESAKAPHIAHGLLPSIGEPSHAPHAGRPRLSCSRRWPTSRGRATTCRPTASRRRRASPGSPTRAPYTRPTPARSPPT